MILCRECKNILSDLYRVPLRWCQECLNWIVFAESFFYTERHKQTKQTSCFSAGRLQGAALLPHVHAGLQLFLDAVRRHLPAHAHRGGCVRGGAASALVLPPGLGWVRPHLIETLFAICAFTLLFVSLKTYFFMPSLDSITAWKPAEKQFDEAGNNLAATIYTDPPVPRVNLDLLTALLALLSLSA